MRVCMLIPSFYPLVGGAERQLYGLLPFLQAEGVQPFILTRRLPGTQAEERIDGVRVVRTWARGCRHGFMLSAFCYLAFHKDEWDLVHVHTTDSPALVAATVRWLFGKPAIVKVTRSGPTATLAKLQRTWWGRIRLRYLCKFVDGFIIISKAIKDELLAIGVQGQRLFTIPNGVDIRKFHPVSADRGEQLRQELGLPDGPIATYIGRLIPRKRIRLLIELWSAVLLDAPTANLLIIGDGPERDDLEAAVQAMDVRGQIRFLGQCEQQETVRYLQVSDCFVLPSTSEGLSNALLEAMATGIVPIVSNIEGNLEVISNGVNGLVFSEPEDLGRQLLRCLTQEALRSELGVQARQTIVDRFSMSQVASQLSDLYNSLVSGNSVRG